MTRTQRFRIIACSSGDFPVKSQLKAIYAKTGVDNRARLTRLLSSLARG